VNILSRLTGRAAIAFAERGEYINEKAHIAENSANRKVMELPLATLDERTK
jgi:hypothetical protein